MGKEKIIDRISSILIVVFVVFNIYINSPLHIHLSHVFGIIPWFGLERVEGHSLIYLMSGILNIAVVRELLRGSNRAFIIEAIILVLGLGYHFVASLQSGFMVFNGLVLLFLFLNRKRYNRKTQPTIKDGLVLLAVILGIIGINSIFTIVVLRLHHGENITVMDTIAQGLNLLMGNHDIISTSSKTLIRYQETIWVQGLVVLLFGIGNLLRPVINRIHHNEDVDIRKMVVENGQNPLSYLTLEKDKDIYIGKGETGICGYKIVGDVFVICGDMIFTKGKEEAFIKELTDYCNHERLSILMVNTTEKYMSLYEKYGLKSQKFGEDAVFKLEDYNLKGGKVAKVRAAINHGIKDGITVREYRPLEKRDMTIEKEIDEITSQWIEEKGGSLMEFTVGGVGLDNPMDRRYFIGEKDGEMLGFVVFLPYDNKDGYLADVTRRKAGSPQGVLEMIIYQGFMTFKDEGATYGNMGLSPLYNVENGNGMVGNILNLIYDKLNGFYDFKSLHHSKEKFAPTHWENRYLVYTKNARLLSLGTAMIKVQYPQNIFDIIIKSLRTEG